MPAWHDEPRWNGLLNGEACPICLQGKPWGIVAELESAYVTVDAATKVRGYCCLVLKRHAVEIHDLSEEEGAALMRDVRRVSRLVQGITGSVKINWQIHGNTIPHLHVHVVPRYRGDELEGAGKGLGNLMGEPYTDREFSQFAQELQDALSVEGPE